MAKGKHSASENLASSYSRNAYARPKPSKKPPIVPIAAIVVILLIVGIACYIHFSDQGTIAEGQEITFTIEDGATLSDISATLRDNHLITSRDEFEKAAADSGYDTQLKSGTYTIIGGTSVDEIIAILVAGRSGTTVTILEGDSAKQISERVEAECGLDADEFYALTLKASAYAADYPFLEGAYNDSLEGYLFPGTYTVSHDMTCDGVIRMMLDEFSTQIAQVDMSYAQSKNLTVSDVVILASIVQKESGTADDMGSIASVFYNRLHAGMNLGSDVTTYYAVGKELGEELTTEDLASTSPYNTRNANNKSLPPGPIASPGMAALTAAAHPDETNYLYFFWSDSQSQTMFFEDAESFNAAWAKYGS